MYSLKKKVLQFQDPEGEFLKGYSTNVLESNFNAFVDIKGRVIAVFDQVAITTEKVLIALEEAFYDPLMAHIEKYLPLCEVQISLTNYQAYFDIEGSYILQKKEYSIPQKTGQIILTPFPLKINVSEEKFTLFRLNHTIPIQGVDFHNEMLLNIHPTNYISFTKGCFLGQEILSRVHFKSKPPLKLIVSDPKERSLEEQKKMTSVTLDSKTGDSKGFFFAKNKPLNSKNFGA